MISTMIENSPIPYNHYEKDWDNLITQQNKRFLNAMADFEDEILTLLDNQISPIVIKLSLFYQWARLISWTHNLEDTQQTEWLAEIEQLMLPVGKIIRNKITSLGTRCLTQDSTSLAPRLTNRLTAYDARMDEGLTKDNIDKQFYMANEIFFKTVERSLQAKLNEKTLSSMCLYYWFKCYSAITDIAELDMLKLEHQWGKVMESVWCLIEK